VLDGRDRASSPAGELDLVCLSGRGDKDLAEVLAAGEARAPEASGARGSSGGE
jgi:hypothetical protein